MDLFTYYIYISYCEDNDIKKEVILQLETMMIQEGLQQKMQQTQMAMQGMEDAGAEQAKQAQSMARGAQTTTSFIGSMQRDNKYPTLSDIRTE
jgi:hypothetical protein